MITGFGRTGKLFGCNHDDVVPDIMTMGKGMASGYPMSALVSTDQIMAAKPFSLPSASSSSYGGNPLAAAAALVTIQTILSDKLVESSAKIGRLLQEGFEKLATKRRSIANVRGRGLLIGFDLVTDQESKTFLSKERCIEFFKRGLAEGLIMMSYTPRVRVSSAAYFVSRAGPVRSRDYRSSAGTIRSGLGVLRGAIIGFGAVAANGHWPAYAESGEAKIVAVVDRTEARRNAARASLPGIKTFATMSELAAEAEIDFVDICTPPSFHAEPMLEALGRGWNVLCEKPLVLDPAELENVREAVRATAGSLYRSITGSMRRSFGEQRPRSVPVQSGSCGKCGSKRCGSRIARRSIRIIRTGVAIRRWPAAAS